jgi:hypothetical protein
MTVSRRARIVVGRLVTSERASSAMTTRICRVGNIDQYAQQVKRVERLTTQLEWTKLLALERDSPAIERATEGDS